MSKNLTPLASQPWHRQQPRADCLLACRYLRGRIPMCLQIIGIVSGVAHAAPILQAGVGYFAQQAPCFQFCHGCEFRDILAADVEIDGAISQRTQGFDFGLKFRQTKMNDLKIQHAAHSRSSWKCCI